MVNQETIKKIEELLQKYKHNWGKEVDLNVIPRGMSQEELAVVLEHICETGESVLVGWNKCFIDARRYKKKKRRKYHGFASD